MKLEGVLVDLLQLRSVKALAEQLLKRGQRIDAVVWNAGIAGWKGLDWPRAIWAVMTDLVHATTYPTYPIGIPGLVTKKQLSSDGDQKTQVKEEPQLGQVFTANVFGHYMLTHWLAPLLPATSRIVWISSISALPSTFFPNDTQALTSHTAYESSKRLTDLLVLTSHLPSTSPYVSSFLPTSTLTHASRPKMYLTHPGVVGTSIAGLHWLLDALMFLAFYLARLLNSPWHVITPYKGAIAAVYTVLSPSNQLPSAEETDGKGKWGSATDVLGNERVARTETEGWGFCGVPGKVPAGSVRGGRYRKMKETTKEVREEFEEVGRGAWRELEGMRKEWEGLLGPLNLDDPVDVQ